MKEEAKDLEEEKTDELTKQLTSLEIKEDIPEATKTSKYLTASNTTLWSSKVISHHQTSYRNPFINTNQKLMKMLCWKLT